MNKNKCHRRKIKTRKGFSLSVFYALKIINTIYLTLKREWVEFNLFYIFQFKLFLISFQEVSTVGGCHEILPIVGIVALQPLKVKKFIRDTADVLLR